MITFPFPLVETIYKELLQDLPAVKQITLAVPPHEDYQILEIDRTSSADDIKKAYRVKARRLHPDLGGDHDQMKRLNQALERCLRRVQIRVR